MNFKKLICLFKHDWQLEKFPNGTTSPHHEQCSRCPKKRFVLKLIMESDARKMGVSEEAIQRGYITKDDLK